MRYHIRFDSSFYGDELRIPENCHSMRGGLSNGLFCHTKPISIINRVGIVFLLFRICYKSNIVPMKGKGKIVFKATEPWFFWINNYPFRLSELFHK